MTIADSFFISWSTLLDIWEKQDPDAFEYFYQFHTMNVLEGRDLTPYERLIQINEIQDDSNSNFLDSLIAGAETAVKALPEYAYYDCIGDSPSIDFCETGVIISF
jgi:hypothetical protein